MGNIVLDELKSPIIDLKDFEERVTITGMHIGARLLIKNASNHKLHFFNARIKSTHPEDAIAFEGDVENLILQGAAFECNGAITFWRKVSDLWVNNLRISDAHTGIRITQDYPHKDISILYCHFSNISHEGVYIGVSKATEAKLQNVEIIGCKFTDIEWDAIQVGNCNGCEIYDNSIDGAGTGGEYGQDYGITINPGSIAYLDNNKIVNTAKRIQILDSRAFFHRKRPPVTVK